MTRCAGCGVGKVVDEIDDDRLPVCAACFDHVDAIRRERASRTGALLHLAQVAAFRARYGEPGKGGGK